MSEYKGLKQILKEFKRRMLLAAHPINTVYMTTDTSFDPNTYFGGTWQKLPDGVFLRNAGGNAGNVGTTQEESLPNIRGNFSSSRLALGSLNASGAFADSSEPVTGSYSGSGYSHYYQEIDFNANNSNSIYKDNGHVTPYNYCVHMWLRTA